MDSLTVTAGLSFGVNKKKYFYFVELHNQSTHETKTNRERTKKLAIVFYFSNLVEWVVDKLSCS